MKKDVLILIAAILLAGISVLHSQDDVAVKNSLQTLKAIKTSNADVIDKQKKTLDGLDDTVKNADQIRILAKRT